MATAAGTKKKSNAPRAQISQETFDEVVKENMEDFDMDLAEATHDAVQQFESQGVDLSNIIKLGALAVATDGDDADTSGSAPQVSVVDQIKNAIRDLQAQSTAWTRDATDDNDTSAIIATLTQLQTLCDRIPEAKVVAGRNDAVDTLVAIVDAAAQRGAIDILASASALLVTLCTDSTDNQDFVGQAGIERLARVLENVAAADAAAAAQRTQLIARVLSVVRAACTKHEANKSHFAKARGIDALSALLPLAAAPKATTTAPAQDLQLQDVSLLSKQLAHVLRTFTVNDDATATFSQAHETIKVLVANDALATIVALVDHHSASAPDVLATWLAVLKQLAVTEESCTKIYDLEGLTLLHRVMHTHEANASVMTRCITVMRNVAAADALKQHIVTSGGVERVLRGMRVHSRDAALQQHACATLAAIALRAPANSVRIVELGGAQHIAQAMDLHNTNVGVLRQASLAIRNIVARAPELRARVLEEDTIEPLLRTAQQYRGCGDEAYAALRDLGCAIELAAFGTSGSTKAQFNPVQEASNALLEKVDEAAEAPFAHS